MVRIFSSATAHVKKATLVRTLTFHVLHGRKCSTHRENLIGLNLKTATPIRDPLHMIFTIPINFNGIDKNKKILLRAPSFRSLVNKTSQ